MLNKYLVFHTLDALSDGDRSDWSKRCPAISFAEPQRIAFDDDDDDDDDDDE